MKINLRPIFVAGTLTLSTVSLAGCGMSNESNAPLSENWMNDLETKKESTIEESAQIEAIESQINETGTEEKYKDFGIGEHILSIPVHQNIGEPAQYEYHEGYEVVEAVVMLDRVDVGDLSIINVIYENTEPVKCRLTSVDDDGKEQYESFGTPIENEKVKTK